ncbi:Uncharacterised protein [Serratia fonticola]|nr:Uncharacterised protein [Serratia fonticola]
MQLSTGMRWSTASRLGMGTPRLKMASPATQGYPFIAGRRAKMDRHAGLKARTCNVSVTGCVLLSEWRSVFPTRWRILRTENESHKG